MNLKHAALKQICRFPIRGRHRLVSRFGEGHVEILTLGNINLPLDLAQLTERYIFFGLYEPDFVAHLRRTLRPGDVMLDPGANLGYITAVAADLVGSMGRVIALEPSRICFDRLLQYLDAPNVSLINTAVSHTTGTSLFFDTPRVLTRGFACLAEYEAPTDGKGYQVETITIDDLCIKYAIERVRYLKLDVEGAELSALRGALGLLSKQLIDFILVETEFGEESNSKIFSLLTKYGYYPFKPDARGRLHPIDFFSQVGRFDVVWKT